MVYKFGILSYINALPFYAAMQCGAIKSDFAISFGVPTTLNHALQNGQLDLAFISSTEYLSHPERYVLVDDFCIGARERVGSVKLYLKSSIASLEGKTIACTSQSASSIALLRLLCHHFWRVEPSFAPLASLEELDRHEGFLLIGDDCLSRPEVPPFHSIDLAQAWYYATGLPFTFAVLAARPGVNVPVQTLRQALQWARENWTTVEQVAAEASQLPLEMIRAYYPLLRYDFDLEQQKGFNHLRNLHTQTN